MSTSAVQASNIKYKRGGKQILDVEQFCLDQGEIMALIGINGSGKSTLVQVLSLLQRPDSGKIIIQREEATPQNMMRLRRRMAVVFQEPLLLDTTVYNNVATGLRLRGHKKAEMHSRVMEWLARLGVDSLARSSTRFLSGGEAQRVSLARALVLEPEVLFLDEPFAALDYPTKKALHSDFYDIIKATKISTLIVTHDPYEIPALANRVTVLEAGRIIQQDTTQNLFANPANDYVAFMAGAIK
ncbi:MAG: ABC transporter ATP-binding protein [Desulfotomaculaceae bacterium]|nr:ABC transporter ATP-binding protein [Desulfotomaculaceae bacterium]MDD4766859.1 ABC transporter ATP-binding protein [Desulfotomaculaceae bacterium]